MNDVNITYIPVGPEKSCPRGGAALAGVADEIWVLGWFPVCRKEGFGKKGSEKKGLNKKGSESTGSEKKGSESTGPENKGSKSTGPENWGSEKGVKKGIPKT
jgi:hypothetical protein